MHLGPSSIDRSRVRLVHPINEAHQPSNLSIGRIKVVVVDIQLRVGVSWTSCVEGGRDEAGPESIVEHV